MTDYEKVKSIIQNAGYIVNDAIDGLEISDGQIEVGLILQHSPDDDEEWGDEVTDCFVYSSDNSTDGHLTIFHEGYPEDLANEILENIKYAFQEEREYRYCRTIRGLN